MARQSVAFSDVLDFTRASSAWWIDNNGTLQSAAIDEPRFTEDGVLIERASTNVFLNSDAPVTQTVTVTSGDYTASCIGTGSLTIETGGDTQEKSYTGFSWDASTNSPKGVIYVEEGEPKRIEALSTSFDCNVNGVVDYAQIETSDIVTSIIITGASSVTRSEDVITTKSA